MCDPVNVGDVENLLQGRCTTSELNAIIAELLRNLDRQDQTQCEKIREMIKRIKDKIYKIENAGIHENDSAMDKILKSFGIHPYKDLSYQQKTVQIHWFLLRYIRTSNVQIYPNNFGHTLYIALLKLLKFFRSSIPKKILKFLILKSEITYLWIDQMAEIYPDSLLIYKRGKKRFLLLKNNSPLDIRFIENPRKLSKDKST